MNKQIIKIGLLVLAIAFINVDANAQKKKKKKKKGKTEEVAAVELKNEIDSVSYAIGLNMTKGIQQDFSEGNFQLFVAGIKAGLGLDSSLISMDQLEKIIAPYFQKKQAAKQAAELKKAELVKTDGIKFLEQNKTKEGVVVTTSGLQYIVLKEGTGVEPLATDRVKVHYHGTTPDGTVFDSSVDKGKPITFGLNQVIRGWTEGLQLMKEGAKYKFFIPQELAYGANPRAGTPIKPFMPLVFEVELIQVNPPIEQPGGGQ